MEYKKLNGSCGDLESKWQRKKDLCSLWNCATNPPQVPFGPADTSNWFVPPTDPSPPPAAALFLSLHLKSKHLKNPTQLVSEACVPKLRIRSHQPGELFYRIQASSSPAQRDCNHGRRAPSSAEPWVTPRISPDWLTRSTIYSGTHRYSCSRAGQGSTKTLY